MKVCPSCQSSYPDGFKYCPQDNTTLLTGAEFQKINTPAPVAPPPAEPVPAAIPVTNRVETPPENAPAYIAPRDFEQTASAPPLPVAPAAPVTPAAAEIPAPVVQAQAKTNGVNKAAQAAASVPSPRVVADADFGLNLALPESGGLISRLFGSLKNIKDVRIAPNPQQWLISRALGEVVFAIKEFASDPKKFVTELVKGEGASAKRRNMLLAGTEMAAVGYVTLYLCGQALGLLGKSKPMLFNAVVFGVVAYLVGCFVARGFLLSRIVNKFSNFLTAPKLGLEFATWAPLLGLLAFVWFSPQWFCQVFPSRCYLEVARDDQYQLLAPNVTTEKPPEVQKVIEKQPKPLGGSKPKPAPAGGGGGGNMSTPVTKGVPPQQSMVPQVMPPSVRTPTIKNPSLVVPTTTLGDDALSKRQAGPIGLPDGADAPPSVGNGGGTGIGSGRGAGQGPGDGFNKGGGDARIGGGGGQGGIVPATASMKPTILYKEKAKYTEAARQNRIQGTVLVSAVFTADGRVTDIRVVRGLPDGLNEEAIRAAQKIKFNPAMRNGQAVSVRMSMEFAFNLL